MKTIDTKINVPAIIFDASANKINKKNSVEILTAETQLAAAE